ncbi:TonB-dependent receptor [Asticcacaulis sp. BYS171W]|uniref:TonB-dependent receptor n=1 Tax=Asticcacaulis aquaticus TaxID=2984212 RepID=A0ABT5HUM3_9CAUL|nr:TonB-dependent receptor [Asticcacaulis aquaticus]MDC7683775.1 TonB-dependent receptor [Asticcacaulis aquaticus]
MKFRVSQNTPRFDAWRWSALRDTTGRFSEDSRDIWRMRTWDHNLTYSFADDKGERLTIDISDTLHQQSNPIRYVTRDARPGRGDGERLTDELWREHDRQIKGDYEKPLGDNRILSAGFDWKADAQQALRRFDSSFATEADRESLFVGRETTTAAYVTLQWPLGAWTAMPGLRVEDRRRRFPGQSFDGDGGETEWFPSLHLSRAMGEGKKLRLSYSRRLDPLQLGQYDPQLIYNSSTSVRSGNPDLQLVLVNSVEASYDVERKTSSWGLTVYYRDASNQIVWVSNLGADGVQYSRPANLGQTRLTGFDANWRGPIRGLPGKGKWTHTSSANYKYGRAAVADAVGNRETIFWQVRSVIQYDGPKRGALGGDQFQATASIYGWTADIESRSDPLWTIDLSWQRPLTSKVALVVSAPYILRQGLYSSSSITDTYRSQQTTYRPNGYVRVALNYKFGN